MLDADASLDALHPERALPAELLSPPAIVQQIDLNDLSLSAAFRGEELAPETIFQSFVRDQVADILHRCCGHDNDARITRELPPHFVKSADRMQLERIAQSLGHAEHAERESTASHANPAGNEAAEGAEALSPEEAAARQAAIEAFQAEMARAMAERFAAATLASETVEQYLRETAMTAARALDDPSLMQRFQDPELSTRSLLEVLGLIDAEARSEFVDGLIRIGLSSDATAEAVAGKLGNVLHFIPLQEQASLVESLRGEESPRAGKLIAEILDSTVSLEQLTALIDASDRDALRATGHPEVLEKIALEQIATALRQIEISEDRSVDEILADTLQALQANAEFSNTIAFNEYAATYGYNVQYYADRKASLESESDQAAFDAMMREKLSLELRYGVVLAHSETPATEEQAGSRRDWDMPTLASAKLALESLQEGALLHTPRLFQITRVDTIFAGALGIRLDSGVILVSDEAVEASNSEQRTGVADSLAYTLVHEIGHSMQMGTGSPFVFRLPNGEFHLSEGDPEFDFNDFEALSGWEFIAPDRWQPAYSGLAVELDGKNYPVGEPIFHDGEWLVLRFNQGMLLSHDIDAQFSLHPYSRTNPWEDFAEAFAKYHLTPERLIDFAPEKFEFFEQELRMYAGDAEVQGKLASSLRARSTERPGAMLQEAPAIAQADEARGGDQ